MKKLMFASLALGLLLWVAAGSQVSAQQNSGQQNQPSETQTGMKSNQNMSGNVSSNGRTFVNDKNNKQYKVDNPDSLKGHEGQHVALIVHVDPDTGVIHIMQIDPPDQP
jgi:hypothetical protein